MVDKTAKGEPKEDISLKGLFKYKDELKVVDSL